MRDSINFTSGDCGSVLLRFVRKALNKRCHLFTSSKCALAAAQALLKIKTKHAQENYTLSLPEYEEILDALVGSHYTNVPDHLSHESHHELGALLMQVRGPMTVMPIAEGLLWPLSAYASGPFFSNLCPSFRNSFVQSCNGFLDWRLRELCFTNSGKGRAAQHARSLGKDGAESVSPLQC